MSRILIALLGICAAFPALAQSPDTARTAAPLDTVIITATRTERSTFNTPQPVTVLDARLFHERLPNGLADLFRDFAGLDASGVGPNQRRPEIRGMRGQRILLLQDGLRLNNSRRQQDFGELPALAGIAGTDRVEIVRGPSSVLYGSDAIGGVINIISQDVPTDRNVISGDLMYRYGSAGTVSAPSGSVSARLGRFAVRAGAAYRNSEPYRAPAGTFGSITLAESELVHDSGIRDRSHDLFSSFEVDSSSSLYARAAWYSADDAGFGFIDPARLGQGQPRIQILYPDQSFARYSIGYRSTAVPTFFAHRVDISGYTQRNERHLNNVILIPAGPGATIDTRTWNFTDVSTVGARLELARPIGQAATLTYGADAFRDRSDNTDSSRTVVTGFGPPITRVSNAPQVPNATFRSAGIFGQLEARPVDRLVAIFGARYQTISAETRATTGLERATQKGEDRTLVWSTNGLFRATRNTNVVISFGRGFRTANLVERFFEGLAPEGNGFQHANPELKAETSFNSDLGMRYRAGPFSAEGFVFRNDISNAIRARATGDSVNRRPAFQNRNIGRLRTQGVELSAAARTTTGFDATASFTRLAATNISDPDSPVGDSYSSKVIGDIGYRAPGGRFTAAYTVRYQGEQNEVLVGANPIGPVIPAFVVHSARASVVLLRTGDVVNELAFRIDNIGNRLYAEFPNASFFRPEPGRNVSLAFLVHF